MLRFVGFSGSLRKGSFNTALLRAASELLSDDVHIDIVDIGGLPLYNADLEIPSAPEQVVEFRQAIRGADAFLIVSPEYNYSIPGGLKNAIDWGSRGPDRPFAGKPVAVMGATTGMWGTVRMQLAFRPVFLYLDMIPLNKPEVLVADAPNKFDPEGKLLHEQTKEIVRQQLVALKKLALETKMLNHSK
ncbi:MAG TPA: NAD(P)H-dependent oxidoreductase [Candidatus Kryptonia bacterium]